MQTEIDSAAGIIWRYLNENGEMTLSKLKRGTRLAAPLLLMGIGWLSREEKLSFTKAGRIVRVSFRELRSQSRVPPRSRRLISGACCGVGCAPRCLLAWPG